ncbi:Xanthine and CO dehydrogenase maturation factor, XdhC/CoxF family [Stigmatella aurantiaca]|uniref:Xanthine and CO dehydrogenase maturation factor, XdhC/CoxF family n=1 Tax=Stigmatella aurantiaca TaxID=41 RepID=A0A1H8CWD5_STIAU|nr:XdhC/CoxI family protein [Stigmatella aurantiaca]SEM98754.1 Xanthine and CO dehydrogenase maturation factor, XdhC/CoxF family [Stigmatella aurantiaca]
MKDLDDILRARARTPGPYVMATVVAVAGSAYRRPGARMLMAESGWLAGGVSGGCLEGDIVRKAFFWTAQGPHLLRYDSTGEGADDEGGLSFALGCNGVVDVLLERWEPGPVEPLAFAEEARRQEKRAVVATVYRGPAHAVGARLLLREDGVEASTLSGLLREAVHAAAGEALAQGRTWSGPCGGADVLVEVVEPPAPVVLFGGGFDVVPMSAQAAGLGFHVTVVADKPLDTLRRRFPRAHAVVAAKASEVLDKVPLTPRTLAVLMTHSLPQDRLLLPQLLARPLRYLGVLGPRSRTEKLLAGLPFTPTPAQLGTLHAPVGLDVGAEGADEVALSIAAELRAVLSGREGGKLRERQAPIHAPAPPLARRLA